jgi:ABC-2 type transport system ATP-binding protein
MNAPAIEARGLRKDYGAFHALDGVDLTVAHGEVFALLGPNGAGKTTLVEILEGYRRRTRGEATVLGTDPARGGRRWRARVGIVPQQAGFFEELTIREVVEHFATFYPTPLACDRVIAMVGLQDKRNERCSRLSGGQKRRIDLALAIVGDPELIFLDEPTTGFDPAARHQAWDVVAGLIGLGKTVLLTTHYMDEAEALAATVGVIVAGRIVAVAAPRELGGRDAGESRISFRPTGPLAQQPLPDVPGLSFAEGLATIRTPRPTETVGLLAAWARAQGVEELPGLTVTRPSLEDVYLDLIRASEPKSATGIAT